MTPLMLASIRGGGTGEMGLNEDEQLGDDVVGGEGSDSMIAGLILHGASLKAKTKSTGMNISFCKKQIGKFFLVRYYCCIINRCIIMHNNPMVNNHVFDCVFFCKIAPILNLEDINIFGLI